MIRKKDCCGCGDWKSMLKELWMKYQDVVKGVKAGGMTAYPDGDGIADVTDAVASAVEQQISIALDDYVTDDELSAAIQYFVTQADIDSSISTALTGYQQTLVSGTNIKTVNGNSLLGSGNLVIQGGGGGGSAEWGDIEGTLADQTDLKNALDAKQNAPSAAGTAGQVLGLDNNLDPIWVNQSGGSVAWGQITGSIENQTDLSNYFCVRPNLGAGAIRIIGYRGGSGGSQWYQVLYALAPINTDANSIPARDGSGCVWTATTPSNDKAAINKEYADGKYALKTPTILTREQLYDELASMSSGDVHEYVLVDDSTPDHTVIRMTVTGMAPEISTGTFRHPAPGNISYIKTSNSTLYAGVTVYIERFLTPTTGDKYMRIKTQQRETSTGEWRGTEYPIDTTGTSSWVITKLR